jgi:hypothetical protein
MHISGMTECKFGIAQAQSYRAYHFDDRRYNLNPSKEELIMGIRLAQMWNVPRLFNYSLDHFKRQFRSGMIHPAVVLAVARENEIPSLIRPAVEALAEPAATLTSWCSKDEILSYTGVKEVSAIARMKERLCAARLSILDVPPVTHGVNCGNVVGCAAAWEHYWLTEVGRKICRLDDDTISHQLWYIRSEILKVQIPAMSLSCLITVVDTVGANLCWFADRRIIEGAVLHLMVTERIPNWNGHDGN